MSSLNIPSVNIAPYPTGAKIGFVGLGYMGSALATNLALALPQMSPPRAPLVVYNRTQAKADALKSAIQAQGGQVKVAANLAQVVQECHIIFTSLADDAAVRSVYEEMCKADLEFRQTTAHPGEGLHTIWVDLSACSPATTGAIELQVCTQARRHFLAAPVLGTRPDVKAKDLVFATAGAARSKQAIRPLLVPAMGKKAIDLGGNHELASTFKLISNSFVLGMIELLGETMTLADKTDVGAAKFFEFLQAYAPESPEMLKYGQTILNSSFEEQGGHSLDNGIKTTALIRNLAMSVDCPLSTTDAANQHMVAARANADPHSHLDWSALVAGQRLAAGLDPWKGKRPGLERD